MATASLPVQRGEGLSQEQLSFLLQRLADSEKRAQLAEARAAKVRAQNHARHNI